VTAGTQEGSPWSGGRPRPAAAGAAQAHRNAERDPGRSRGETPGFHAILIALFSLVGLLAVGPAGAGERTCGDTVFADWQEGGIDRTYPLECYSDALASLPEDVRVYSSAPEDIARARRSALTEGRSRSLSGRATQSAPTHGLTPAAAAMSAKARSFPLPILVAIAFVLVLGVAGSSSLLAERRRLRRLSRRGP
jgi:hypothetical protein